ncbi:hypothetical protein GCM10011348_18890 [Marinobacterium nitratireducens]|uniref:Uncharacterized protein n=1 Tax=Marinobacterium nitratireducens TaxID=518897 RepID=A0A918DSV1_9GAMM|nr:hypothetical protein [Marinobacterium nitratireducens]GGO80970.1 hypothetical protein GCM10011348_18890 [Marinobacterium nitratireducens]
MSDTRNLALNWLKKNYPEDRHDYIKSSKYFYDCDIWYFTCPISYLDGDKGRTIAFLLQNKDKAEDFHYIRVPRAYLIENKDKLDIRQNGQKFDLRISGKSINWFMCERSKNLCFRQFEK